MKTSSLERLVKTQLLHDQALAILEVMEAEFTERDGALAGKGDLLATQRDLQNEFGAVRNDLRDTEHRIELKLESLRTELKTDIQGSTRWNFLFWVTQLAAVASLLKFVH